MANLSQVSSGTVRKSPALLKNEGRTKKDVAVAFAASAALFSGALASAAWAIWGMYTGALTASDAGSFSGGLAGPLTGGASVLLVYATLRIQQDLLERQFWTQRRQALEATLFKSLEILRNLAAAQRASRASDVAPEEGSRAFSAVADELQQRVKVALQRGEPISDGQLGALFESVCLVPHSNFGHYLRTLYYLVQFAIEEGGEEALNYTRIIRAQLSNDEMILLFFNGLSSEGSKTFKKRIEDFSLLKGLRLPPVIEVLKTRYDQRAFSDSSSAR